MKEILVVQACTSYPPDRIGGVENIVKTLNESMNQPGFKCITITRYWKRQIYNSKLVQVKTPSHEGFGYVVWAIKAFTLIRKLKPDIVHCHGLEGAILCILLSPTKIKRIMHIHNSITREPGYERTLSHKLGLYILRTAVTLANLSICPTHASKNDLTKYVSKKAMGRVIVIPNFAQEPLPVSEAEIQEVKNKYKLSNKRIILYFGKIKSTKGIENICKAYRIMSLRHESCVVLAGMQTATDRFMNRLRNDYPEVIITGYVNNPSAFYKIADVFCIYTTSFSGGETFALSLAEAMRHGVPIVASDNPIYKEVTNNLAIYAKPDDPENLAQTLDFALQNRDIIYKNAIIAKKYADNVYNEKIFVRSIFMTYRSVLEPK
jgi:glycosyltransferase involved in cell wall biosynthesis